MLGGPDSQLDLDCNTSAAPMQISGFHTLDLVLDQNKHYCSLPGLTNHSRNVAYMNVAWTCAVAEQVQPGACIAESQVQLQALKDVYVNSLSPFMPAFRGHATRCPKAGNQI